jgi:S-adenosylmethionine:tRNA ribosyltransferase-isomerase
MDVRDFDFELPPELIAQQPAVDRGTARLLHLDRRSGRIAHGHVSDLPELLQSGDLLVVNNTRVFPARLMGRRIPSGGTVECLLVRREVEGDTASGPESVSSEAWEALMHPGQKLKPGARVAFGDHKILHGEVVERRFFGRRLIRLWTDGWPSVEAAIDSIGHVPLPPYIKRADTAADRDRYQTMFARPRGSIAAPTAGLHFTASIIETLRARGIDRAEITLHVGYGTFQPVRVDRVEDHRVEAERYEISTEAAAAIESARREGRRVVAVGTTTTRTLETVARAHDGAIVAGAGTSDLFIYPGFQFRVVGALLTNFHLPQSSLLMLVSAFAGREHVLGAYHTAVAEGYRFYSYGDAMLIT